MVKVLAMGWPEAEAQSALAQLAAECPFPVEVQRRSLTEALQPSQEQWSAAVVAYQPQDHVLTQQVLTFLESSYPELPLFLMVPRELSLEAAHAVTNGHKLRQLLVYPLSAKELARCLEPFAPRTSNAVSSGSAQAQVMKGMEELWERFRPTIKSRVETVGRAATALREGTLDEALREAAVRDAHKLAGAVGTFGFSEASKLARTLEVGLQQPMTDELRQSLADTAQQLYGLLMPELSPAANVAEAAHHGA